MSDQIPVPPAPPAPEPPAGPGVSEAWNDVVTKMNELGDAIAGWAKAAANDPENKRHLDEMKAGFDQLTSKASATVNEVAQSDIGQQVGDAANQAGAAVSQAAEAAAPHVASAFGAIGAAFGRAAEKMEGAVSRPAGPPPPAPEPPPAPSAPSAPPEEPTHE